MGFKASALGDPLGPGAFPLVLAILLAALGLMLFFSARHHKDQHKVDNPSKIAGILTVLFAYAFLLDSLGFLLATALAMFTLGLMFGAPWRKSIVAALLFSLIAFVLFDWLLDLPLPVGNLFGF